jgi:hypothetical protein
MSSVGAEMITCFEVATATSGGRSSVDGGDGNDGNVGNDGSGGGDGYGDDQDTIIVRVALRCPYTTQVLPACHHTSSQASTVAWFCFAAVLLLSIYRILLTWFACFATALLLPP